MTLTHLALIAACAALVSAGLCIALRPLLQRYALARPNARSSHTVPTPQGGGIAVLAGIAVALLVASRLAPLPPEAGRAVLVTMAAATLLAAVGAWDDIRPLPATLRLALQALAVAGVVSFAAPELRLLPEAVPLALERGLVIFAGVWFVNLVNFMDGLDWITIAGLVPLAAALALAGSTGLFDPGSALLAAALAGGLLGFAPFNRPVARLFLGDVGSLPLGLVTAYLLYRLAGAGGLAAALILPLYHIADATITLLRRLARGERVWEAHRSHFYQQAVDHGFSAQAVFVHVAALNLGLVALACAALRFTSLPAQLGLLALAALLTGLLLRRFSRPRRAP